MPRKPSAVATANALAQMAAAACTVLALAEQQPRAWLQRTTVIIPGFFSSRWIASDLARSEAAAFGDVAVVAMPLGEVVEMRASSKPSPSAGAMLRFRRSAP